jgi:hypothetical protein
MAAPCRPYLLEHVLDHRLALVARGQVDVDVRPLAALLGQEALEEQLHADGIDGGDAERVADRAVGGGAAALGQHPALAGEAGDVLHDQEVAGEVELPDHGQLVLELAAGAVGQGVAVAAAGAGEGEPAQPGRLGLAGRRREDGEAVAEVGEPEGAALGHRAGGAQPVGAVGEEARHLGRRLQVPLGVGREAAAGAVERGLLAQAGQHVEQRAVRARACRTSLLATTGTPHASASAAARRAAASSRRSRWRETSTQVRPGSVARTRSSVAARERGVAAHQRDEVAGVRLQLVPADALRRVLVTLRMGGGEQPRQVPVAAAASPPAAAGPGSVLHRDPRADDRREVTGAAIAPAWWKRGIP